MAFDWREFLVLARDLEKCLGSSHSREAVGRTVVSRAYYAAFCHVRNYAELKLGFQRTERARDHRLLREYLREQSADWQEISEHLEDLQKWRGQCDYDEEVHNLHLLVSEAIKTAEKIIHQCDSQPRDL